MSILKVALLSLTLHVAHKEVISDYWGLGGLVGDWVRLSERILEDFDPSLEHRRFLVLLSGSGLGQPHHRVDRSPSSGVRGPPETGPNRVWAQGSQGSPQRRAPSNPMTIPS